MKTTPGRERGAILVLTTMFWLVLAMIGALIIDLGLAQQRRSNAQAAADAAVLAALPDLGQGDETKAQLVAASYVEQNGFQTTDARINIPPAAGRRAGDSNCIELVVSDELASLFARVLGVSTLDVGARSVGCAEGSSSTIAAVFAGSTTCWEKNLKFSGSLSTIVGGVHSNDALELSGSDNTFVGGVTWDPAAYAADRGSNNVFSEPPMATAVHDWPVQYDLADFQPGGLWAQAAFAHGRYHNAGSDPIDLGWLEDRGLFDPATKLIEPGLYYSDEKVDLSVSDMQVAGGLGVTFVSSGSEINLSGSDHVLRPFVEDLLLFTDYQKEVPQVDAANCDSSAVNMSGANSSWEGIVYAPRGQVKLNGSSNTTLSGSVVAYTIEVSGSDLSIDSTGLTSPAISEAKLVE